MQAPSFYLAPSWDKAKDMLVDKLSEGSDDSAIK